MTSLTHRDGLGRDKGRTQILAFNPHDWLLPWLGCLPTAAEKAERNTCCSRGMSKRLRPNSPCPRSRWAPGCAELLGDVASDHQGPDAPTARKGELFPFLPLAYFSLPLHPAPPAWLGSSMTEKHHLSCECDHVDLRERATLTGNVCWA